MKPLLFALATGDLKYTMWLCNYSNEHKDKKETAACLAVNANSRKYSLV